MGSPWALVCSAVLVLVSLSSASTDDRMVEQREVTSDLFQKEMQPDPSMMQVEVDWSELLDPKDFIEQVIVSPPEQFDAVIARGQPSFGPRSFGGPPMLDYPVQFPLGRPTSENLQAICLHGDRRPRYPDSYFPDSGFGQQKRMARAVNKAESWFSTCCNGNQTWGSEVTLCCTTQAWELSVKSFCEENASVKDRQYRCCKQTGSDRLNCFNGEAPNPNYEPTEEIPLPPLPSTTDFTFDPKTCQRTVMTQYRVRGNRRNPNKPSPPQKTDINFPPGRPTADTIDSLCRNQNLRPLYNVKCLPGLGFEMLSRQAKTINRMEKGFKQCCKKKRDVLSCADQKWSKELNKFCSDKNSEQVDFVCCVGDGTNDRNSCFQNLAPDPHFNMTSATEELSLNKLCDAHKIKRKKFRFDPLLKSLVDQCCPLPEQDKTICSAQKLEEISKTMCSELRSAHPDVRRCCRMASQETPQCISKFFMDTIDKATNVSRQMKKKRCPIS